MIKVVIFDADGVLINGRLFSESLEENFGISTKDTREFFYDVLPECVVGKKDLQEVLPPYLKKWGWKKSVDDFIDAWHTAEHNVDGQLVQYIQDLRKRGIICALATNQTKQRFGYMLNEMGFKNYFDKVYASAHIGYQKPDLEFYKRVFEDIGRVAKNEVLFWDDSPRKVAGAREFGIHGEVYTSFEDFKINMQTTYKIMFKKLY